MDNKEKIAVFGGTFNPPTKAHKKIINFLSDEFKEVIVLPVFSAPWKSGLTSFEHRMNMVKLIIDEFKNVSVSDLEKQIILNNNLEKNYTYQTMSELRKGSTENYVFVHGPDINLKKYEFGELIGDSYLIPTEYMNRSTTFREHMSSFDFNKAESEVPKNVWKYITQTKIFDPKIKTSIENKTGTYLPLVDLGINYSSKNGYTNIENCEETYVRNLITPKDSVGITLYDPITNKILIKREKRFGPYLNEGKLFSYGVIEGTIEPDEDPVECAIREIEEEAGISVSKDNVIHINSWYPSAGYMTEKKHVMLAIFDSNQYNKENNIHGLKEENEEIFTELFDLEELEFYHTTKKATIFSPEISASLLYINKRLTKS